jgi:hypothetical protein
MASKRGPGSSPAFLVGYGLGVTPQGHHQRCQGGTGSSKVGAVTAGWERSLSQTRACEVISPISCHHQSLRRGCCVCRICAMLTKIAFRPPRCVFELPGTAGSGSLDWLFLDLPLRTENGPAQSLQIPDLRRDQRRRRKPYIYFHLKVGGSPWCKARSKGTVRMTFDQRTVLRATGITRK